MLTDSLRVLLLEASGYDAQIFEFVSLEHTSKNKMILATRRPASNRKSENARRQIRDLKSFYGIRDHRLEALLEAGTDSPASFAERHPGISGAVTDSGSHPVDDQARPR